MVDSLHRPGALVLISASGRLRFMLKRRVVVASAGVTFAYMLNLWGRTCVSVRRFVFAGTPALPHQGGATRVLLLLVHAWARFSAVDSFA